MLKHIKNTFANSIFICSSSIPFSSFRFSIFQSDSFNYFSINKHMDNSIHAYYFFIDDIALFSLII